MNAEIFNLICNGIVFASAVLLAVKNIAEMAGKPIKFIKTKSDKEFENKVIEILNKVLPEILLNHDHEPRVKYLADRQKYLEDIKKEVLAQIGSRLQSVDALARQYTALEISAKDVLREKIVCMYENNKDARKLRHFEKRALD